MAGTDTPADSRDANTPESERSFRAYASAASHGSPTPIEWFDEARSVVAQCVDQQRENAQDLVGTLFMARSVLWGDFGVRGSAPRRDVVLWGRVLLHWWWILHARDLLRRAGFSDSNDPEPEAEIRSLRRLVEWIKGVWCPATYGRSVAEPARGEYVRTLWARIVEGARENGILDSRQVELAVMRAEKSLGLGVAADDIDHEFDVLDALGLLNSSQIAHTRDGRARLGWRQIRDALGARRVAAGSLSATRGAGEATVADCIRQTRFLDQPEDIETAKDNEVLARSAGVSRVALRARQIAKFRAVQKRIEGLKRDRRRRACLAALEYLARCAIGGAASRQAVAKKHGVTVEQLRAAEKTVEAMLREGVTPAA